MNALLGCYFKTPWGHFIFLPCLHDRCSTHCLPLSQKNLVSYVLETEKTYISWWSRKKWRESQSTSAKDPRTTLMSTVTESSLGPKPHQILSDLPTKTAPPSPSSWSVVWGFEEANWPEKCWCYKRTARKHLGLACREMILIYLELVCWFLRSGLSGTTSQTVSVSAVDTDTIK